MQRQRSGWPALVASFAMLVGIAALSRPAASTSHAILLITSIVRGAGLLTILCRCGLGRGRIGHGEHVFRDVSIR